MSFPPVQREPTLIPYHYTIQSQRSVQLFSQNFFHSEGLYLKVEIVQTALRYALLVGLYLEFFTLPSEPSLRKTAIVVAIVCSRHLN